MNREYISGCKAAAEAVRLAGVEVISAYPITPQTSVVDEISKYVYDGKLTARFVPVEGEHSAISVVVGAAMTGARTFTATSSQGLALMHEVLYYAAGLRLPIVMAVANRSIASPVTIFTDHQDTLPQRETGFMQIYVESCQEILDYILIAYKIAEDEKVLLPIMVCFDGFFLSHIYEPVVIPEVDVVEKFIPKSKAKYPILDIDNPKCFNVMAFPEAFEEFQHDKYLSMLNAASVFDKVSKEFERVFDRKHMRLETYKTEDAESILVGLGSMMGTVAETVDELRSKGKKVGAVKIKCYRPLPIKEIVNALKNCRLVGILDRDVAYGTGGIVYQDMCRSLYNANLKNSMADFIVGLGGRDVTIDTIKKCFAILDKFNKNKPQPGGDVFWPDANLPLMDKWKLGDN